MPRLLNHASVLLAFGWVSLAGCSGTYPRFVAGGAGAVTEDFVPEGEASYYGEEFSGKKTSNGEIYDPSALTAAHRSIPFDAKVKVTHLGNGRSVIVRINDRGPWKSGRIIDLSLEAARRLGMLESGTALVRLEIL